MVDQEALDFLERLADGDVDAEIELKTGDVLLDLGAELERYDDLIERGDESLKLVKAIRTKVSDRIVDVMRNRGLIKNNGTGNYAITSGCKVSLRNSTKPGVKVENHRLAYEWFTGESQFADVMYRSAGGKYKVDDTALLAAVKAIRKAGRNVPPFIGTFEIVKAVILNPRKAKETSEDE